MKLTTVFNWKMSIHFKQFQEDSILPFTYQKKKKLSLKGLCRTSSLEAKSCLTEGDEDLEHGLAPVLFCCSVWGKAGRWQWDVHQLLLRRWQELKDFVKSTPHRASSFPHPAWQFTSLVRLSCWVFSDLLPDSTGTKITCCVWENP